MDIPVLLQPQGRLLPDSAHIVRTRLLSVLGSYYRPFMVVLENPP